MQKYAFLFPGQGSQFIGMGADLAQEFPVARMVFQEVDDALHQSLSSLMFSGDKDDLIQTQNAQPAIMAVSVAIFKILETEGSAIEEMASMMAGHSLGEYSALCVSGALSLSQTARLLKVRGQAMAEASRTNKGGMLALLGATLEQAQEIATKTDSFIANDNCVGQIVLSGVVSSLASAQILSGQMKLRAIPLAVSGGFHCPLMQPAAECLAQELRQIQFNTPKVPIYFNVLAQPEQNPALFSDLLIQQLTHPVRWRETILNMPETYFVECGPGTVLSGLMRRIGKEQTTLNGCSVAQVKDLIEKLSIK